MVFGEEFISTVVWRKGFKDSDLSSWLSVLRGVHSATTVLVNNKGAFVECLHFMKALMTQFE